MTLLLLLALLLPPPSLPLKNGLVDLSFLKSGSDIRGNVDLFSSLPVSAPSSLTLDVAFTLGQTFTSFISASSHISSPRIAIGRDPRPHGENLGNAFAHGVLSAGGTPLDINIATTPSVFHCCDIGTADGGVMITASHLPAPKNGMKLFTPRGPFEASERDEILTIAGADFNYLPPDTTPSLAPSQPINFMPIYIDSLINEVKTFSRSKDLKGLRILVNSGGGSGFHLSSVLEACGAEVIRLNDAHTGDWSERYGPPNPESKEMSKETIEACAALTTPCNLACMLDTDADRVGFVVPTASGGYDVLNRNRFVAVLSKIACHGSESCAVVTDSVTSTGLGKFIEKELGHRHVRFKKGYLNVINEGKRLVAKENVNCKLAIETSGHSAFAVNGWLDDGTYSAVRVICELKNEGSISKIIENLEEPEYEEELRMAVNDDSVATTAAVFTNISNRVSSAAFDVAAAESGWCLDSENREGIRVVHETGFFMLRPSLHDPIISFQLEAGGVEEAREVIKAVKQVRDGCLRASNSLRQLQTTLLSPPPL